MYASNTVTELQAVLTKYAERDLFDDCHVVSPETKGPDGDSPFHIAAYDGDIEAAKVMLPYISDIDFGGDIGNSPLHYAVLNNKPKMARFLLLHGADLGKENDYGDTPVDYMEGIEVFRGFC